MQSAIGDKLARELLAGEIRDGDTVLVDVDDSTDQLCVTSSRTVAVGQNAPAA